MAALQGAMALLDTAIDAEGQVPDATTAWSACMTDAGHPGIARPVEQGFLDEHRAELDAWA